MNEPAPATAQEPLLLTVTEAARVLAVGRTTIYELIAQGALRAVHIGRAARIPRAAIEDLVEQLEEPLHTATPRSYAPSA